MKMISVIGAGPIGAYTAYLLAKSGEKVRIFEEHSKIGRPIQCAGIVSKNLGKIVKLEDEFVINKVKGARIYSPNNEFFEVKREIEGFILDRDKFDKYLIRKAVEEGAELFLKHRFLFNYGRKLKFEGKNYETDVLIGADGSLSKVAKCNNMFDRKFWLGLQARVRLDKDKEFVELYMGNTYYKDGYGWVVPEGNNICRVGIITTGKNAGKVFNSFLKKFNKKIIDRQSGLIPVYDPKIKMQKGNVYLVGDAAGQAKATTGGGIVIGMGAAEILVKCLLNNKDYKKEFNKKFGRDMWMNLKIRERLNKFDDDEYNELIRLMNKEKVKNYMCRKGDMDFPSRFFLGLLFKEPRLLKFCFRFHF